MRAVRAMGQLLFAAGAEEVLTGIPVAPRARSLAELDDILAARDGPRSCTCPRTTPPARSPRAPIRSASRPTPPGGCAACTGC